MTRLLALLGLAVSCALGMAVPVRPEKFSFVDLESAVNQKLAEDFGMAGNHFGALPKGRQSFANVKFWIGKGVVELGSKELAKEKPNKVEGIKIGKKFNKIHFLHATEFGNAAMGDARFIADGTKIAEYKLHYEDGKTEVLPVVFGTDVRDWWFTPGSTKGVTRGKVAWEGDNQPAKAAACRIRLYLNTWNNPRPRQRVLTVDYLKAGDCVAAPFCVAITVEE